jgi:hypothetical protein
VAALVDAPAATPEVGMRGSHDDPLHDAPQMRARQLRGTGGDSPTTLERAAAGWRRRGYRVRYEDPHLIQLVRAGRPTLAGLLLIGLAAPLLALAALLVVQGLRRRHWHTVSITITPDERIVTHRQWSPYPPEEPPDAPSEQP